MKWVKASERMPDVGKIKFMKAKGWGMFIGVNSINDGKIHESSSLNPLEYNYELIEWLDESTPPVSAMEDGCPTQEQIDAAIDKYAFRVPYDGTNNFYDEVALKHFKAGIEWFKSTLTTPTK